MNWKLRIKNKATLTTLILTGITFVYLLLGMLGITPKVGQSQVEQLIAIIIDMMAMLGIVVDPTTAGLGDTDRARSYKEPYYELEAVTDEEEVA